MCGEVEPSMFWLQTTVGLALRVVVLLAYVLRTTILVILVGYSPYTTGNTLSTFSAVLIASGLVCNESLLFATTLCTIPRHERVSLSCCCLYLGTGDILSLYKIVRGSK